MTKISVQGTRKGCPIGVKLTERDNGVVGPRFIEGPRFIARGWGGIPGEAVPPPQRHKCRAYALNVTPMGTRKGCPYHIRQGRGSVYGRGGACPRPGSLPFALFHNEVPIPAATVLHDTALRGIIYINDAEALAVALRPFIVVQE